LAILPAAALAVVAFRAVVSVVSWCVSDGRRRFAPYAGRLAVAGSVLKIAFAAKDAYAVAQ
jgi:hypothetical protein